MLELESAFSPAIAALARSWFKLWDLEAVGAQVRVRFSKRMFRTVGRCYPVRRQVVLAAAVAAMGERQLLDILCHEFAHIAAYEHYGRAIKPHGREWQSLVRHAGFQPSVRFDDEASLEVLHKHARQRPHYAHRCPNCAAERIAARRMARWRCGACYELGYDGKLEIIRVEAATGTAVSE